MQKPSLEEILTLKFVTRVEEDKVFFVLGGEEYFATMDELELMIARGWFDYLFPE